jgi:arylsulfatase A-like enzyme
MHSSVRAPFFSALLVAAACSGPPEPHLVRLVDVFTDEMVEGRGATAAPEIPRTEWRFSESASIDAVKVLAGASALTLTDGLLAGRTTNDASVLHLERTKGLGRPDQLHAVEVRLRVSEGQNLSVETFSSEKMEPTPTLRRLADFGWTMTTPLVPGDEMRTYTLRPPRPILAVQVRQIFLRPSDAAGAEFRIESIRVVFRNEHLASIESGVGFQGMSEIYRESIVSRSPETLRIPIDLPSAPRLDVAFGTVDDQPVAFHVEVDGQKLTRQTVTTPYRWEEISIDLAAFAGRSVTLSLSLESDSEGAIGVWGTPVVRQASAAAKSDRPRGVIVLWADTLRRDHLDAYGYERETAPTLKRMAEEGALFRENVAQATWTKVSTPSLLTSLYPSTHGVKDFSDYLPASATTLAEVYREAGYATVSFASNLFPGQFTNLHQGFEELHEDGSLPEVGSSKTSREYVDRFTRWLGRHRDVPFFAFLHVYDPHDPFEPRRPYSTLWADPSLKEKHEKELAEVREVIEDPLGKAFGMPSRAELEGAGIDADAYVRFDKDWYDGSIRGMDAEVARIFERLRELGLDRDTLVVFLGDHGEEFLEHGRTFHGQSVHGELTNVPLMVRWPAGVPSGVSIDTTTQTIDVMPTLLELSGIEPPEGLQGQSLVPLLRGDGRGFRARPAISEKAQTSEGAGAPWPRDTESYGIVDSPFKLIHNRVRKGDTPEYELFDVTKDPGEHTNVASDHPDVVKRLSEALDGWYKMVNEAKLASDAESTEGLSQQQLERLRSLGYIR